MNIKGLVQGVSYRYNTVKVASSLGLSGTVKNLKDGSVEVVAEGEKRALADLVDWCKEGPTYARVARLHISWDEAQNDFNNEFKII